jgi:muconolactone delta-isomerase
MQYLVRMNLAAPVRPATLPEGINFIEQAVLPTLQRCRQLRNENAILAGGPSSGAIALVFIIQAGSASELDELITSLPIWPRMEVEVTPLTTFEARERTVRTQLERLEALEKNAKVESAA